MTLIAKRPPRIGAGPFKSEAEAREDMARANAGYGGPGFYVEHRDGYVDRTPHA